MTAQEENTIQVAEVYDFFLYAVREYEAASQQFHDRQYEKSIASLQESANNLVRSLLSAKGKVPASSNIIEASFSEFARDDELISRAPASIASVLSLEPVSLNAQSEINELEAAMRQYEDVLVSARRWLARELNYCDRLKQRASEMFTSKKGRKISAFLLLLALLLIATPMALFHFLEPEDSFDLGGQVFWKENENAPMIEQNSKRFAIIMGKTSQQYTVVLDKPVMIHQLRLDPGNKKGLTEIEVEWIRLFDAGGKLLSELDFNDPVQWYCVNCTKLESALTSLRLQPLNSDPYIVSPAINQAGVRKITVKLRAVANKTFWEWVLGIDKTMIF